MVSLFLLNVACDILCDIADIDRAVYILLEKDRKKQDELFQKLYDEIAENIVPVRPDRHFHRTKGQLAGNYSNTHKCSY